MKLFGPTSFIHVGIVSWQLPQLFFFLVVTTVFSFYKQNTKYWLLPFQNLKPLHALACDIKFSHSSASSQQEHKSNTVKKINE